MSGLGRAAFWVINFVYNYCTFLLQLVIVVAVAMPLEFTVIVSHDLSVSVVLFLVFGLSITSFSFFLSTFFTSTRTAGISSVVILIISVLICQQVSQAAVAGNKLTEDSTNFGTVAWPMYGLSNAMFTIAAACPNVFGLGGKPLTLGGIGAESDTPLGLSITMLFLSFVVYTMLFVYCDMVLKVGPGVKQPPLFFLQPTYWRQSAGKKASVEECSKGAAPGEAAEVSAERERVKAQQGGVRAIGLSKLYPGAKEPAVQNVQFGIQPSECFGLLGSNGAGKSTTIHILCGVHQPTTGTVLCGPSSELDIRHHMPTIQSSMGVCSQDNLLWGDLKGDEHLLFFARLRRIPAKQIPRHITYWLKRVNLASKADRRKRSKMYSGGMKRRLGVANAFIGNPQLVYLDEPSTGLDPESRQQLWYAVRAAKKDKSIILTTHALEEAEALCDRVGIMAKGLMRTVGTPTDLRLRFDKGYKFMMAVDTADPGREATALTYVKELLPAARCVDSINGVHTYVVPKDGVKMSTIFSGMTSNKDKYHIKDWGLSHTTLEEVFLQIVNVHSLA